MTIVAFYSNSIGILKRYTNNVFLIIFKVDYLNFQILLFKEFMISNIILEKS